MHKPSPTSCFDLNQFKSMKNATYMTFSFENKLKN